MNRPGLTYRNMTLVRRLLDRGVPEEADIHDEAMNDHACPACGYIHPDMGG